MRKLLFVLALATALSTVSSSPQETIASDSATVSDPNSVLNAIQSTPLPGPVGNKIMLYCGNDGRCSDSLTLMAAHYYNNFGETLEIWSDFPSSLDDYKLVFL